MDEKGYEMLRVLFKVEKGLGFKEWLKKTQKNFPIGKDAFITRKKELEKEELIILKKRKYCITIRKEYRPIIRVFYKNMHFAEKRATKISKVTLEEAFTMAHELIMILWYNHNRLAFPLITTVSIYRGEDFIFSIGVEWIDSLIHEILGEFSQRDENYAYLLFKNIEKSLFPLDKFQLPSNL